jgi:transcriptional regulator with XRE-family HTH domain
MEKFGSWLLEELDKRNMSQSDLARASGVTPSQISHIVSEKRNAGTKSLMKIAQALKLPVDFIFEKAGLLPPNSELSLTKRTLIGLIKGFSDSDVRMVMSLLEERDDLQKDSLR